MSYIDYILRTPQILAVLGYGYKKTPLMVFREVVNKEDHNEKLSSDDILDLMYCKHLEDDMKVTLSDITLLKKMYPNLREGLVRGREYFNQELGTVVKPNYQNDDLGLVIDVSSWDDNFFDYATENGTVCPKWMEVKAKILMYFQAVKRFNSAIIVIARGNKRPKHAWVFHFDEKEQAEYRSKVKAFRDSVASGIVPEFTETDVEFYKSNRKNELAELSEDEQKQFEELETQYVAEKKDYDVVYKDYTTRKKRMDELKTKMLMLTKNMPFCGKLLSLVFTNPKLNFNTEAFLAHIGKKFNIDYETLIGMKAKADDETFNILVGKIAKQAGVDETVIRAEVDNENCLRGVTPSASCKINK